jgi:hypothetical protein
MNETTKNTTKPETTKPETDAATTPATTPEIKLPVSENVISALDRLAQQGALAQSMNEQFKKAFIIAECVQQLRDLLTPAVMKSLMKLQNTTLGFQTDNPQGYKEEIVRDCIIEGIMNGVMPVGNQLNILCSRCYITKNGMKHKLKKIPGLYRNITPGLPKASSDGSGAVVVMSVDWTYQGKHQKKDLALAIRVNRGMGTDAIIGKATRKASAWLYEEVTGNSVDDGDASDTAPFIEAHVVSPLEADHADSNPATPEAEKQPSPTPAQNLVEGELDM